LVKKKYVDYVSDRV